MTATLQQHNSKDLSTNVSLLTINSIHSTDKYRIKRTDKKTYRSGAWYVGQLDGTQRTGRGQFNWQNGGCYDGNYVENKRQGDGRYTWPDGSLYVGNFHTDLRHGLGDMTWTGGESYSGQFFKDMRHGIGTYTWKNATSYTGNFRNNKKCGFGTLYLPNGDMFEGIYKDDQRCGSGIYTYKHNGAQDVGLWKGGTISRLCSSVEGALLYEHMSDHYINAGGNISRNLKTKTSHVSTRPNAFTVNVESTKPTQTDVTVPSHFPLAAINEGIRSTSAEKGRLERMSQEFLKGSSVGDLPLLKCLVEGALINTNVCDRTGYFALLAASVNCHIKVINYLLDNGANINQLTDQGLSSLSACHILLYAEANYVDNISENMSKENLYNSAELDKKSGTVVNRNERKMILAIYEDIYKPYGDRPLKPDQPHGDRQLKPDQPHGDRQLKPEQRSDIASPRNLEQRTPNNEQRTPKDVEETRRSVVDENEECIGRFDTWKLDFYHRSMARVKEVDEINRTFKDIMLHPHKITDKNVENIDLCSLGSIDCGSRNSGRTFNSNYSETNKISTTAASIMGYDVTFNRLGEKSRNNSPPSTTGTAGKLINTERRPHLLNTIQLLLSRGADPNSSSLPMPVLFFAVKSAEPDAVKQLLDSNADTSARLDPLKLCALHIAAGLPCDEGVRITELLLEHGADPNARDGYLEDDVSSGRTALHIACSREDDYKLARSIALLLLSHGADPDLLCFGNSPLSLAIASGNDLIVDILIQYNADVSLKLSHGLGSILCVSVSFQAERLRTPFKRLELVEKLIKAGADMLGPVTISSKLPPCTVMDYAYHVYYQDRRISCTPYHALSSLERECYNARRELLDKLAVHFRACVSLKEKELATETERVPSQTKVLDNTDKNLKRRGRVRKEFRNFYLERMDSCGLGFVTVKRTQRSAASGPRRPPNTSTDFEYTRRYRYCNECGRSVGIRLAPCPRCKEIFYCSKNCKVKLWNARHREECAKTTGIKSPSIDINTVDADTVSDINSNETTSNKLANKLKGQLSSKTTSKCKDDPLGFLPHI